ncbi:SpoIIE family protein phosphatase [Actinocrinis puniceicyclus]|uniref:SpoIIE family protein phosphatase n=1 Tax=Actinocrinis puniceicyclus TaxID=977794 RepID=A0A8J7WLG4_9ACTN|nr:SpoIIE family protein phosphatase [Actinocrinis puniceicyclus]MBS2962277.1 SpoIIE family protein phosphatase [Actinocrinis puniceicyclus]
MSWKPDAPFPALSESVVPRQAAPAPRIVPDGRALDDWAPNAAALNETALDDTAPDYPAPDYPALTDDSCRDDTSVSGSMLKNTALRDPGFDEFGDGSADARRYPAGDGHPIGERVGALLAAALGAAPRAIALVRDHEHRVDFVNRAFREAFGLRAEAGGPLARLVPQFAQLGLLDALDHVFATGTVFIAPEVRVNGYGPAKRPAVLRVTCSPVHQPEGGPVTGALVDIIDCTDQVVAVDRLRAGERRHRYAAVALQRSLLPQRLSQPDDLRIAGVYLPGAADNAPEYATDIWRRVNSPGEYQVGGDWYDVIPLGAGRTAFVIGDVMGRGVHAAAVMGQLRAAVRAYAAANLPPGELLLHLDRHAAELEGVAYAESSASAGVCDFGALATAVYAVYDPDECVLTYANAGHPAPLLRLPEGMVVDLDAAGGPPLGTGEWTWQEACVTVPPGSYLTLFTDGLVERRGVDLDDQLTRLRKILAGAPQLPAPRSAERHAPRRIGPVDLVRDELLAGMDLPADHDDDVALLVVHVPRWQGERAGLFRSAGIDLVGGTEIAAHARAFASGVLRGWHIGEELCDTGVLAVSELVANAATHGRPPVRLRLRRTDRRLIVDVYDGDDHLPRRRLANDTDESGRGIGIVATLASSWGARLLGTGKSVWCEFALPAPRESARRDQPPST